MPIFYAEIVSTRSQGERLDTLEKVRAAGIHVCCGGIVGMGESRASRAGLIAQLANLDPYPRACRSTIWSRSKHAAVRHAEARPFEFVRTIAAARITMPKAMVRLSAGREDMSSELQALCFLAGANSIFYGERLLTTVIPMWKATRAIRPARSAADAEANSARSASMLSFEC